MTITTLLPALDRFIEATAISRMDAILAPIERKAERRLSAVFKLQSRLFLERLATMRRQFVEADPPSGWQDAATNAEVVTQGQMVDALVTIAEDALLAGLTEAAIAHGLIPPGTLPFGIGANAPAHIAGVFDLKNPRAVSYMATHGAALVSGINETTRSQIRTLLTEAMDNGWSYDRTAREIRARYAAFATSRARTIAVTESANAYRQGNVMMAHQMSDMGLAMEQRWLASGGACPLCESNAAQGWIDIDDSFVEGEDPHPRCRCDILTQKGDAR